MPCGGEGPGNPFNGLVEVCCQSVAQTSSACATASREQTERESHFGSPDPIVTVAWLFSFSHPPQSADLPTPSAVAIPGDGVLTYLRTGRLRL